MNVFALRLVSFFATTLWFASSLAADQAFAWQATRNKNTVYLVGSLHVGKLSFYPLSPSIERAFKDAEVLAVEADVSNPQATLSAMTLGMYAAGDSLAQHLSAKLLQRLEKQLPKYGMNLALMANLRPFMVMSTLVMAEAMRHGYDPTAGVDLYFLNKAAARGMTVVELESVEIQMRIVNGFTDAENEAMLGQMLSSIEKDSMGTELAQMVAAWQAGDAAALEQTIEASFQGQADAKAVVMEKLNHRRNLDMTRKIEQYLASGKKHFVVVGGLHLVGARGIVRELARRGYQVKQLTRE